MYRAAPNFVPSAGEPNPIATLFGYKGPSGNPVRGPAILVKSGPSMALAEYVTHPHLLLEELVESIWWYKEVRALPFPSRG